MQTQEIDQTQIDEIIGHFETIDDWKEVGPFCVDGRDGPCDMAGGKDAGKHLYVQALGGSLLIGVIGFIGSDHSKPFNDFTKETINRLRESGFGSGVHRGSHCSHEASDCGFADNLPIIIKRLSDKQGEIKDIINSAAPGLINEDNQAVWDNIVKQAATASSQGSFTNGETLVADVLEGCSSNLQTLEGDHAELSAVVNLKEGTTLNTGKLVAAGKQSFNLDLWYVLKQAAELKMDEEFVKLAALGLYVATEMVLVEDKKQVRLPVLVHA